MPSAPLFYQPLVMARVTSAAIGKSTVAETYQQQQKLIRDEYADPKKAAAIDGFLNGITALQGGLDKQLPGTSTPLVSKDSIPQFAFDEGGWAANRVMTTMRLHPELFDATSPDQAAEIGANLVKEALKELEDPPGMKAVGGQLEIDPTITGMLKKHWSGEEVAPFEAAAIGVSLGHALQEAVTPIKPDTAHPTQWLEDGSTFLLSLWPGAAAKTAAAIGIKVDAAKIEEVTQGWRSDLDKFIPKQAQAVRSVHSILGAAGISEPDDATWATAFQVLQSTPLEGVPGGIAQAIVGHNKLPADKSDYLAGRIVETTGSPGNVTGLLAEIELMKTPPPVDPPPGGPTPPPGGGTPPPGNPNPEPPPGGTTPPPVDPPKTDPPVDPPKTDPPKTDPPKTDPPKTDPPKTDPPKTDPPKTDPPKEGGGVNPTPEEVEAAIEAMQAELGPHPANDIPNDVPLSELHSHAH